MQRTSNPQTVGSIPTEGAERKKMKIGDLVRIKNNTEKFNLPQDIGVIIDIYQDDAGYYPKYEVRIGHERGWFDSIQLEVISGTINRVIKDV